ncbi:hypothetical protein N7485_000831 [Penicillium canescens]|nr:hypothetical protein N7485_000831 [Penicillium canescens]
MEISDKIHPLLMERPRSSGVDVEAFSFAKPASHRKPFTLKKFPKNPLLSQSAIGNAQPSSEQTQGEGSFNGQLAQLETYVFCQESILSKTSEDMLTCFEKHSTPAARDVGDEITFNFQTPGRTSLLFQPPQRLSMSMEQPKESGSRPGTGSSVHAHRSSLQLEQAPTLPQPNETIRTDDSENPCTAEANVTILESSPNSVVENANEAIPMLPGTARPRQKSKDISINAPSRMSLNPVDSQPRGPEQRRTKQKRPPTKRLTPPVVKKNSIQLGEDDLFELLIMKMREREENEQKSASIQQQIETENSDLKGEIHSLHNRLESCQTQLVKSSSDAKIQRGQIDKWKARLAKFKDVINELGLEYDTLREQTSDLKLTTSSLHKEKAEIQQNLEEIKLQVAENTNTIEGQRSKISSSEGMIAMLREALDNSGRRDESMKSQLSHEKKRVVTLESYIQNESQSQARYLTIVRKGQNEMIGKLESACKLFTTTCSDSRDAMTSTMSPVLERCISSIQELKEQCCVQTMDVEKFTGGVQEAVTRIDALAGRLAKGVETNMDVSNGLSRTFQEGLRFIEGKLGPGSSLCKQLASSETRYGHLQENLEGIEPMISSLNASVKATMATETDLVHCLEIFGQRLAEAQIPAGNPVLEMEVSTKFAENTQLQLELQNVSIELGSLRKQLSNRASENEHLQHALAEAVTNEQASKSQNSRLEIEKTALRGELQLVEQKVREDLNIASTKSQDRLKANFERQIQGLEAANAKLETHSDQLTSQLVNFQRSLAESEKTAETERLEKLEQSERQVEELNATCSKYMTEAKAKDIELQRWKSSEAELRVEKERLLGELELAAEKTHGVEASLALKATIETERLKTSQDVQKQLKTLELELAEKARELQASLALNKKSEFQTLKSTQEAEKRNKALELETNQKTEELAKMNDSLEVMKSRSLALEKVGEEADSEIIALLRRAQEAESWQATIREGFARIIEMRSDEPFEQTWQKVENILQSSPNQRPITMVSSDENLLGSTRLGLADNKQLVFGLREGGANEALEVDQRTERVCETIASCHTDLPLSQRTYNASKPLTRESVDWLPKMPIDVGHIVPFASLQDKLSREDSLSLFNDQAELEMLFMSTPDLQGPADAKKPPKASQGRKEMPAKPDTVGQNVCGVNSAVGKHVRKADDSKSERSNSALAKLDDPFVDTAMKSEQSNTKRKVVSFEGPDVVDQPETGRPRRISDAIDNSSGKDSEDKALKRTQKRTYSRLRQSVAQEETSVDTSVQSPDNTLAAKPQVPTKTQDSDAGPAKPTKMARNATSGPERRLSPKGLASGSSKITATATRARTKRTTRGDRYSQRFSQNA